MNRQNILNFYGSKLDLKLDSSELYDYELGKVDLDFNSDVLDLDTEITYNSIKINNSLSNMDCDKNTITLQEFDNTVNDEDYIFSGLTFTLSYSVFISHFDSPFDETILNNNIFIFTGFTGEIHYFKIFQYNRTDLPLIGVYGYFLDNADNILLSSSGDSLIFTDETTIFGDYLLTDVGDDTNVVNNNNEILIVSSIIDTPSKLMEMFSKEIIPCSEKLNNVDNCCSQSPKLNVKPWAYKFDSGAGNNNCDPIIKRRTEKGWTLDFIFNRNHLPWWFGNVFYYIGVRGENNPSNYADNNLSFEFTSDARIRWVSYHYSGVCGTEGFDESFYISSGQTPQLCVTDSTKDFNVTIVFDRYKRYTNCNLENDGGWNDLIPEFITSDYTNTGFTAVTSSQLTLPNDSEILNKKWSDERQRRLGVLKIYLNGRPIYKLDNWEEIIPSERGEQPYIQSWGGGTGLMNGIHYGVSCFDIKSIKYYEEPLNFVQVRHNFLTKLNSYDFEICGITCDDDVFGVLPTPTPSPTPTHTPTSTPSPTPTHTPTVTPNPTSTSYPTNTPSPTHTPTPNPTNTLAPTPTGTIVVTPTSTPFITPTPYPFTTSAPSGFTFDADYIIVSYSFTDGTDLDTRTRISNPDIGQNDPQTYLGWCRGIQYPDNGGTPILTWSGDNTGQGFESVFINLIEFKNQYPSETSLTIEMNAMWYGDLGTNPVVMDVMLYKGGTVSLIESDFLFINQGYSGIYGVASNGTVVTLQSQECLDQQLVAKLQYNLNTHNGQFI